jgi:hypothetical protein
VRTGSRIYFSRGLLQWVPLVIPNEIFSGSNRGGVGCSWGRALDLNPAMPAYHKAEIHAERRRLRIVVRIKRDAHQIGCASQHQRQQKLAVTAE